jgi:hypothetical protein
MAAHEAACRRSVSAMKFQDTCLDGALTAGVVAVGMSAVANADFSCTKPAGRLEVRAVGICPECA